MPIAQRPGGGGPPGPAVPGPRLNVAPPNLVSGDPGLLLDHVVAIVDNAGVPTVIRCGAHVSDDSVSHVGFFYALGPPIVITTGRGSTVTPHVQGGSPLIPGEDVWVSTTPGEVTQLAPTIPTMLSGLLQIRVGVATSTTEMVLNPDARFFLP